MKKLFAGLRWTFVLWLMFFLAEKTWPVRFEQFRWQTFKFLEGQHSGNAEERAASPVIIVDIGGLPAKSSGGDFTSRREVEKILAELTCNQEEVKEKEGQINCTEVPSVIGVDIDFSPESLRGEDWRFVDPQSDPQFFDFCRHRNVKIFLGVNRTIHRPYEYWLGMPEYSSLAAALPLLKERTSTALITGRDAPTFASALASTYLLNHGKNPPEPESSFFFELDSETGAAGVREALIDYSADKEKEKNEETDRDKVSFTDVPGSLKQFEDKIVIIGDAYHSDPKLLPDTFDVPTMGEKTPGVWVHAAAVRTLIDPERRLRKLKPEWDITADLILAGSIILLLTRWLYYNHEKPSEKLSRWLFAIAGLLVLVLGIWMFKKRLVWDGFLIVAFALCIHPYVEGGLEEIWQFGKKVWHPRT